MKFVERIKPLISRRVQLENETGEIVERLRIAKENERKKIIPIILRLSRMFPGVMERNERTEPWSLIPSEAVYRETWLAQRRDIVERQIPLLAEAAASARQEKQRRDSLRTALPARLKAARRVEPERLPRPPVGFFRRMLLALLNLFPAAGQNGYRATRRPRTLKGLLVRALPQPDRLETEFDAAIVEHRKILEDLASSLSDAQEQLDAILSNEPPGKRPT